MNKSDLKIAVIGGGHLGIFFSTMLISCGYDVEMVCRDDHRAIKIDNAYAFSLKGDFGDKSYLVPYVTSIDKLSSKKDIIIFTTKTYDMIDRISDSVKHLTPKGMIVTIQNVYTIDKLYNLIPPECSVCMMCDFAAQTTKKITYVRDFNGLTLGVYNKKAINRMKLLGKVLQSFIKVYYTNDIVGFTMGRNIINGAISLLGGISGLRLKDMLKFSTARKIFCKIIEESYNICKMYRINVLPYNNQLDYEKFTKNSFSGYLYRRKIIKILIKLNGRIKSSALDDIEKGNPTEIGFLIDAILEYGKRTKSSTKYISAVSNILAEIESGKRCVCKNIFNELKI